MLMVSLSKTLNGYGVFSDGEEVGVIEYKDFWDGMPYLSLMKIIPGFRNNGVGTKALKLFESEMKSAGHGAVLLSTQSDEGAQHFYRKAGYSECGCLILENSPFKQAMELFFFFFL